MTLAIALLATSAAPAQTPSLAAARAAIEENLPRTFTRDEQLFLGGIAHQLLTTCKLPRDRADRARVERFAKASTMAVALQESYTVQPQTSAAAAFAAGVSTMDGLRCRSPEAALLSRGIVLYLERTANDSRFVAGCVEFYRGAYDRTQCECIADTLRSPLPDVDERYFDRALIQQAIHQAPWIAFPLMFSCRTGRY